MCPGRVPARSRGMRHRDGGYLDKGAFGAAAASHPQIGASPNITELKNFAQTLGLTAADVRSLKDKYAQRTETSTIVEVACLAAQLLLGADQVDTAPLNQSTVEENW
ncbi:hypothetical protein B0O99DRAFT_598706 [Bisporella sp. PMI_857]|nr:hypothetical protein B0O99DRAFT_598706 [Bisporella sp. PMI_857]